MAGGPGSGKSYTAMEVFGVDKRFKQSFAASGLKVVNSDSAFEAGLKRNGINPKDLSKIEKEDPDLWDKITKVPGGIRDRAKQLTNKQKAFYEAGRLGMVVDGTGGKLEKIKKMKTHAEKLGYDTHMVFVDTSLAVAHVRNKSRDRVLPEDTVSSIWKDVQDNKAAFKNLFGGSFALVDNNTYDKHDYEYENPTTGKINVVQKMVEPQVRKAIDGFVNKKLQNPIGKKWIETARKLKSANMIKK